MGRDLLGCLASVMSYRLGGTEKELNGKRSQSDTQDKVTRRTRTRRSGRKRVNEEGIAFVGCQAGKSTLNYPVY